MSTQTPIEKTKEEKRKERIEKDAAKFREMMSVPRPGMTRGLETADDNTEIAEKKGLELSDIVYVDPRALKPNPLNTYPPLAASELDELVRDIGEKGVIVPLIVRLDDVVVCGHNRLTAALKAALETVPAQRILSALTDALEQDIMRSENDRRRGGNWTKEQKLSFIKENFADELRADRRGGDRKSELARNQNFNEVLKSDRGSLAEKIEKQSRGRITKGTADRLLADIRKKDPKRMSGSARLPEKDRRRAEKLSARLVSVREVIALLEGKLTKARAEEKAVLKELKAVGVPFTE